MIECQVKQHCAGSTNEYYAMRVVRNGKLLAVHTGKYAYIMAKRAEILSNEKYRV